MSCRRRFRYATRASFAIVSCALIVLLSGHSGLGQVAAAGPQFEFVFFFAPILDWRPRVASVTAAAKQLLYRHPVVLGFSHIAANAELVQQLSGRGIDLGVGSLEQPDDFCGRLELL